MSDGHYALLHVLTFGSILDDFTPAFRTKRRSITPTVYYGVDIYEPRLSVDWEAVCGIVCCTSKVHRKATVPVDCLN